MKVYRPVGGQSVWLYHEATGNVELRDSDGDTLATFEDPEDVFTDPSAYPATEKDISDFSAWATIKRPALPGGIDRDMVDVIAVTDNGLEVLEPSGDRIPIRDLLDDGKDCEDTDADTTSNEEAIDETGDGPDVDQLLDGLR